MKSCSWRRELLTGFVCFLFGCAHIASAQDITNVGGDLSNDLVGRHALQAGAPNITSAERVAAQAAGFSVFHRIVKPSEGLGPTFVNSSCAGCHVDNGRGPLRFGGRFATGSAMVVKVKKPGRLSDGSAPPVDGIGEQIHEHSIHETKAKRLSVAWSPHVGYYADGTRYELRKPRVVVPISIPLPARTITSLRMAPPMIGTGLLEAISTRDIVAASDPSDRNKDGISGKANWVRDHVGSGYAVGRFGFKATHPSVIQQSAAAAYHDMGLTNPVFFDKPRRFNLSRSKLHSLVVYLKLAGVPKATNQGAATVQAGFARFKQIGCDACHKVTWLTGEHPDPELSHQVIHPFTDLLLHDMGPGLADGWEEFSANGREWRTTPLWGLGFTKRMAGKSAVFLHDGRARSVEEAILWHGGEGSRSKRAFVNLSASEREELLAFLDSL